MIISDTECNSFIDAARNIAKLNLVQCSSGNLSSRLSPDKVLLSASSAWLGELNSQQVAICNLASGESLNSVKPTCESGFHLGILKSRPDIDVVVHFQSPYATALACGNPETIDYNVIIEVPVYIGKPEVVGYFPPGSAELADAVIKAFSNNNINMVILRNHGLVATGKSYKDAIQKAVFFELACRIYLTNPDAKALSAGAVQELAILGQA